MLFRSMSRNTSVYDFTVTGSDTIVERALSSKALEAYVDHLNRMVTGKMKRPSAGGEMDSLADFSGLREQVVLRLPEGVSDPKALGAVSYNIDKAQPPALNLLAALDGMETAPDLIQTVPQTGRSFIHGMRTQKVCFCFMIWRMPEAAKKLPIFMVSLVQ